MYWVVKMDPKFSKFDMELASNWRTHMSIDPYKLDGKTLQSKEAFPCVRIIICMIYKRCSNRKLPLDILNLGIMNPFGASYQRIASINGVEVIP